MYERSDGAAPARDRSRKSSADCRVEQSPPGAVAVTIAIAVAAGAAAATTVVVVIEEEEEE